MQVDSEAKVKQEKSDDDPRLMKAMASIMEAVQKLSAEVAEVKTEQAKQKGKGHSSESEWEQAPPPTSPGQSSATASGQQ